MYSVVHFFHRPPPPEVVTRYSGLTALGQMLEGFISLETLVPGFFTLFAAGILLAWMYRRTGTLLFSMGLHSGWVFWIRFRSWLTVTGDEGTISPEIMSAWIRFLVIALVLGVIVIVEKSHRGRWDQDQGGDDLP
jgi:membrane protease YdiL (CAAX protease family)